MPVIYKENNPGLICPRCHSGSSGYYCHECQHIVCCCEPHGHDEELRDNRSEAQRRYEDNY